MSAPFQPGDVVVCVDASPGRLSGRRSLKLRMVYRVSACRPSLDGTPSGHVLVDGESPHGITDMGAWRGWDTVRFRKVDAADEQFTARIRAYKPAKASA
jgi:hypothetical protein